jgi:hypothetical protein
MCVLRAGGKKFDVDVFLKKTSLPVSRSYRRGELRVPQRDGGRQKNRDSGLTISVSNASWNRLAAQISDAEQFLITYQKELVLLMRCPGIEYIVLDFPSYLRIGKKSRGSVIAQQSDLFPSFLVRAAGKLGIGLELSIYG